MNIIRRAARNIVDSWLPEVGHTLRQLRDRRAATAPFVDTPYGFRLAGNRSMAEGDFEREEIDVFLKYLGKASICIDIGANIGLYTCLAASQGKKAIAVEPLNLNLQVLYRNLVENSLLDVEVFPFGLSGKPGVKCLYGNNTGASFVPGWAGAPSKWYEVVPVNTLDLIVNTRFESQPLLIKMDVEGFEYEVLSGAARALSMSPRPIWLVEINFGENFPGGRNENFQKTFDLFWQRGYEARTANHEERVILPADVERWVKQGRVDFGSHNFLFVHHALLDSAP
jgi:FkbM family methyltransferase